MSSRIERARALLFGAVMCVGCTAPLILAEEPGVDGPLVPTVPEGDPAPDAGGDPPLISEVDGGRKDANRDDGGFAEPHSEPDAAMSKGDAAVKDASGD